MKLRHALWALSFLAVFPSYAEVRICLTLEVNNDAEEIASCLASVKNIVDCICISDHGSTDKTIEIIEGFLQETQIPGIIHRHAWLDPIRNQTLILRDAQNLLDELNYPLSDSYLLMIRPQSKVQIPASFNKHRLIDDSYLILEKNPCFSKYAMHLLRAGIEPQSLQTPTSSKLSDWVIEEAVIPKTCSRAQFSYCDHQYGTAIQEYKELLKKESGKEEIWFAKYMLGKSYEALGEVDQATFWYLEAFQTNPNRGEPLYQLANLNLKQGKNDLAHLFAKQGTLISPLDDEQLFFDSTPLAPYVVAENLSISSYYTANKEDGFQAANDLVLQKNVPWHAKWQAYQNLLFYVQPLPCLRFIPIVPKNLELVNPQSDEKFHPMNPSIYKTESGYKVNCRTVNYTQVDAKYSSTNDPVGMYRTKNYLIDYNMLFEPMLQKEIVEQIPRQRFPHPYIEGLDDARLFEWNGSTWFTCTTSDTGLGKLEISLCKLADGGIGDRISVERLVPLKGPDPNRVEKNWLPFIQDHVLYTIYSYDPLTIFRPNIETGQTEIALQYKPEHDFSQFRGSAGPIEYKNGYLVLVHEVVVIPESRRRYLHRLLFLNRNFHIEKQTKPFVFQKLGIEYCTGMTLDHSGTRLILAVGIEDREAYLYIADLETIDSLLQPLPVPYPVTP